MDTYQCRVILQGSPLELRRCYEQLRTRVLTFLGKPVTRDNLLRALRRTAPQLGQGQALRTTGSQPALPWPAAPRVLAVDDHRANRLLVGELLRTLGVETTVAASGEEALHLWRKQEFDLIFMDIQMPDMDGIAATRRIREEESKGKDHRRIPIVALTAHAGAEEKTRLLSAGMDDYLSKPVTEAQLSHMIKRWMKILAPAAPAQQESGRDPRPVDIGESLGLSNGNPKLARDLLQMLLDGLAADERELNRLHGEGDHRELFELAHRLHGACCYCGVPRLREAAARVQEQLRPLQEQSEADIDRGRVEALAREIRALRDWAPEQDLDALFGLEAREAQA